MAISPSNETANAALSRAINITQVANLGLSLLTNLAATTTVSLKAWSVGSAQPTAVDTDSSY